MKYVSHLFVLAFLILAPLRIASQMWGDFSHPECWDSGGFTHDPRLYLPFCGVCVCVWIACGCYIWRGERQRRLKNRM
jgi:hypothetical protein